MCYSHFLSIIFLSPALPCAGLSSVGVWCNKCLTTAMASGGKNHGGVSASVYAT